MQHAFGQSIENTVSLLEFGQDLSYEEIDLKMPKLSLKYMSVDDVMKPLKFKNKEFRKYKIVLQGTNEDFQIFKKNSRYKELLNDGFKISFKVKKNVEEETIKIEKKNFLDILQNKVNQEHDSELETIFQKFLT